MTYTLEEIGKTIPTGGKIVAMCQHGDYIVLATEQHVFKAVIGTDKFEQMMFYTVKDEAA